MISSCAGVWHLIDTGDSDPLDWPIVRLYRKCYAVVKSILKGDFDSWWARVNIPADGEQPTTGPWSAEAIARDAELVAAQLGGA